MSNILSLFGGLLVGLGAAFLFWRRRRQHTLREAELKLLPLTQRNFHRSLQMVINDLAQICSQNPSLAQPYMVLGNLYRMQGETYRSVVIHQNLLADSTLPKNLRDRVRIELANDLRE